MFEDNNGTVDTAAVVEDNSNAAAPAASESVDSKSTKPTIGDQVIAEAKGEGQKTVQSEQKTDEQKKAEAAAKRKMKLKVHGQEQEVEYDPNDEKYLKEMFEKALGADKVFQEGALTKKQMNKIAEILSGDNPWEALKATGRTDEQIDELVIKYMEQKVAEDSKPEEQKKIEQLQKELENERKAREKFEAEKRQAEEARIKTEYARNLETEIAEAMKTTELPRSAATVKRLGDVMIAAMDKGYQISVKDAMQIVDKQMRSELQEMFTLMPEEVLEKLLGEENNNRLRKRRIAKQKEVKSASQVQATGNTEIQKQKIDNSPKEKVNAADFFRKLGR